MKKFRFKLGKRGEGAVDNTGLLILAFMVIGLFLAITPAAMQKFQLDTYAKELCRTAEISGRVGEETSKRAQQLTELTGLHPTISWSKTGEIQLGSDIAVTLQTTSNIGFGTFGSIPIPWESKSSGKSEVYWK